MRAAMRRQVAAPTNAFDEFIYAEEWFNIRQSADPGQLLIQDVVE
jgi:hypothetical protein